MSCGNTGWSAFATTTTVHADSNGQHRFEPWHRFTGRSTSISYTCRSSNFGETVIAHVLMVMGRLIDVLVVRQTTVIQHGRWVWQCALVWLLVLNVRRRRRECTFVLLRMDRERVLVLVVSL
jgi:hypothetical protein